MEDKNNGQINPSAQYAPSPVPYHTHNGTDSPKISSTSTSINARSHGTAVTSIASGADTLVQLNVNDFANGVTWDSANHQFKILTAGQYIISGTVTWQAVTDQKLYKTAIYKGGLGGTILEYASVTASGTTSVGPCGTTIADLVVGDTIQLACFQNSGGSQSIYTNSEITNLNIAKV